MNRRNFLGLLAASVGALAIDPASLMWRPDGITTAPLQAEAIASFQRLLQVFTRELSRRLGDRDFRASPAAKLGADGLIHHFGISLSLPDVIGPTGLDPERYLFPMVEAMADRLKSVRPTVFGRLELPTLAGVEEAHTITASNGLTVRGIQFFDPLGDFGDYWKTRVDVLCG